MLLDRLRIAETHFGLDVRRAANRRSAADSRRNSSFPRGLIEFQSATIGNDDAIKNGCVIASSSRNPSINHA